MSVLVAGACAAGSAICGTVAVQRLVSAPGRVGRAWWDDPLARTTVGRTLAVKLERAGLRLGPGAFVAAVAGVAVLAGASVWWILGSAVGGALIGAAVAWSAGAVVASADRRYLDRLVGQLPTVAQQLAGALGAGLSLSQAVDRAARDTPAPVSGELARISRELVLGARVEDALQGFATRHRSRTVELMVSAILVQRSVGGDLAGGLARLATQLDDRGRVAREARSVTAQARMSAWLVAGLPAAGGVMVELASPGTIEDLVGAGFGRVLLLATITLEVVGVLLVRRIAYIDGGAG